MHSIALTYIYWLVGLSLITSTVASYAAFSFANRGAASHGPRSRRWMAGGATVMGLTIWRMHYVGILAMRPPVEVVYYIPTVIVSLLLAVAASAAALWLVSREKAGSVRLALGTLLVSAGVVGMQYAGMAAMRSSAAHSYKPGLVELSVLVAVAFSWMALRLSFSLRWDPGKGELRRIGGAILMGTGITVTHYIAMKAVIFMPEGITYSTVNTVQAVPLGGIAVALTAAIVLIGALVAAFVDRTVYEELREAHDRLAQTQAALLEREQALRDANELLKDLSIRDGLTGVYNRRYFDEMLIAECKRAVRAKRPISLLLIDIDHFKALNDRYGHPAGDECLRRIGQSLSKALRRTSDVVARYGGEEFAVILPGADAKSATDVAEILRRAVLDLRMSNADSEVNDFVTLSIGICTREPIDLNSAAEMITIADEALYRAKLQGRNRVRVA